MAKNVLLLAFSGVSLMAGQLEQGERDRAMSYLHATRKQLLDEISGLSEAQWKWKAAPERWSVAECAEHLATTEEFVFKSLIDKVLVSPASDASIALTKGKDDRILQAVPDRSRKVQAPQEIAPKGVFASAEALATEFRSRRDRTIRFVETTQVDLRRYVMPHPFLKELDAYQWMLFLAAHADRHIQQLREVKAEPGFPKK